jgi:hypothetical protein
LKDKRKRIYPQSKIGLVLWVVALAVRRKKKETETGKKKGKEKG